MKSWSKKWIALAAAGLVLAGGIAGCGTGKQGAPSKEAATVTITDIKGNEVAVPKDLKKIAVTPIP